MKKKRILGFDVETSLSIVTTFQLKTDYISHENILQDWNILCAAWKFFDGGKIKSVCVKDPQDDYEICIRLREVLDDEIIIVGHNSVKFDLKKLNTRLVYHGIDPLPTKLLSCDTLKAAKKHFSFMSNRLDYLGQFLGVGKKLETPKGLWMDIIKGKKSALKLMEKYCRHDVSPLLEGVYNKLLPYIDHPNMGAFYNDNRGHCKNCGSERLSKHGIFTTTTGIKYQRYRCQECGSASTQDRNLLSKSVMK